MLNILSYFSLGTARGPSKVVLNLIKGLDKIRYPYVVNKDVHPCSFVYVPNSAWVLPALRNLPDSVHFVIGPHLFPSPSDIPFYLRNLIRKVECFLHPSAWVMDRWERLGYSLSPMRVWPVGIDTDSFAPAGAAEKKEVLIYHKMRSARELRSIQDELDRNRIRYRVLEYGKYTEGEYRAILAKTSFVIWHGVRETQGIAMQEAMSCNVPVLVCNEVAFRSPQVSKTPKTQKMRGGPDRTGESVPVAPYFDRRCGIIADRMDDIGEAVREMMDLYPQFEPREFILENFSLEERARELLGLFPGAFTEFTDAKKRTSRVPSVLPGRMDALSDFRFPLAWKALFAIRARFRRLFRFPFLSATSRG